MTIKLVACDMDGTLLAPDHAISPRTMAAVDAAVDAGIDVVAVTGRSFRSAAPILAPSAITTAICSNGAVVYDVAAGRISRTDPISGERTRALVEHFRSVLPGTVFGWETPVANSFEPGFRLAHGAAAPGLTEPLNDVTETFKLYLAHPTVEEVDLQRLVEQHLPAGMSASTSGAPFVEVTAVGIDKGTALARYCASIGVAGHEVMAFGDQMNDLPMLSWAGIGVAMGNARPEAVEAADRVTETNAEDGVARMLERLVADGRPASTD